MLTPLDDAPAKAPSPIASVLAGLGVLDLGPDTATPDVTTPDVTTPDTAPDVTTSDQGGAAVTPETPETPDDTATATALSPTSPTSPVAPVSTPSPTPATPASRKAAVLSILAALGTDVLPTASARTTLDLISTAADAQALLSLQPDLRALLAGLLAWDGDKVTKPMVRAAATALTATPSGTVRFSQGVEMLSFVAACAPLLEPDRLARILDLAPETPCAYAPLTSTMALTERLERILGRYSEARRETLLATLWATAHDGRWWDAVGTPRPRRRRRALALVEETPEDAERLARRRGARGAATTLKELLDSTLPYSPRACELLGRAAPTDAQAIEIAAAARQVGVDPDLPVLVAHLSTLTPAQRPPSPIETMVAALIDHCTGETGVFDTSLLPDRPEQWAELYPAAPVTPFPIPSYLTAVFDRPLPGLRPAPTAVLVRNALELQRNRTHMGNCTWSHLSKCQAGRMVIGRVTLKDTDYNFSLVPTGHGAWAVHEVNSRFNGGNVPDDLRKALAAAVAPLGRS